MLKWLCKSCKLQSRYEAIKGARQYFYKIKKEITKNILTENGRNPRKTL